MMSSEDLKSTRSADTAVQETKQPELVQVGQLTDPVEDSATIADLIGHVTDSDQPSVVNCLKKLRIETDELVYKRDSHEEIADKFKKEIERICKTANDFDQWVPGEIYKPIIQRIVEGKYISAWFQTLLELPHSRYEHDQNKDEAARDEYLRVALVTFMEECEKIKARNRDLKQGDQERSCSLYKDLLKLFSQDELGNAMFKGEQQCLLTSIALHERCDIIEYVSGYLCHFSMNPTAAGNKICHKELNEIPLPQSIIQLLNKLTNMYITPHGKGERTQQGDTAAKMYGFVYYNIIGRESDANLEDARPHRQVSADQYPFKTEMVQLNPTTKDTKRLENQAEKEASKVLTWLADANFVFRSEKNWTVDELRDNLKKQIEAIKDNCSVVVVFLMAHGYEGYVTDIDGTSIFLDELDDIINDAIPENIPKVFIIQACRDSAPDSNARKSIADGGMFCKPQPLQEPAKPTADPKDFIRVMTSSKGRKAYRNVFVRLLIDEMEKGIKLLSAVANAGARMPRDKDQKPQIVKQTMWDPLRLQSKK